jgi:hypothetical protein
MSRTPMTELDKAASPEGHALGFTFALAVITVLGGILLSAFGNSIEGSQRSEKAPEEG